MLSCFYPGVPADLAASVVMFNDIQHLPEDFRDLLHQEGVWKGVIVHSLAFFLLMLAEPILHPAAVTAASGGRSWSKSQQPWLTEGFGNQALLFLMFFIQLLIWLNRKSIHKHWCKNISLTALASLYRSPPLGLLLFSPSKCTFSHLFILIKHTRCPGDYCSKKKIPANSNSAFIHWVRFLKHFLLCFALLHHPVWCSPCFHLPFNVL